MDDPTLEAIPAEVDALTRELEEERGRAVAGVEKNPSLSPLFAAHGRAAHRATASAAQQAGEERLAGKVRELRAQRSAAEKEEAWWAAEASASAIGPDGPAPLAMLELALASEPNRDRRMAFSRAAAEALGRSASAREAMLEERSRAGAEVGVLPDWPAVAEGDQLLALSDDAYREVLDYWFRHDAEMAEVPVEKLCRADLVRLLSLHPWDGLFRRSLLTRAIERTATVLKLPVDRLKLDEGKGGTQWPGVHVTGARISFRQRGGANDWQDLLEALGPALLSAQVPPHRREAILGGALGWLLGSLLLEPRWLKEHAGLERKEASDVRRGLCLRRLFALRARAAALRVASEVQRGLSGHAWREHYREALSSAARVTWEGVRAARDGDAAEQALALGGANAGERMRVEVRERYDEDWWRNPRTAELLAGLLAAGRLPGEEGAARSPNLAVGLLTRVLDEG